VQPLAASPKIAIPAAPALAVGVAKAAWLSPDGEIEILSLSEATARARRVPPFLCHARAMARRLNISVFPAYDLLELYAFARPALFALPTPRGLARALDLPEPRAAIEAEAQALVEIAYALLQELSLARDPEARAIAAAMERGGWAWGEAVLTALGPAPNDNGRDAPAGMVAWRRLSDWSDYAPEPPPGNTPVEQDEARRRLAELLDDGAEPRPQQADYAAAVSAAFRPREAEDEPHFVLAEAGTGTGKTLGYIAPASLWAEKNHGPVWISTFTRNLQHQISSELDRLYPDPVAKARRVVVRKGRENYLCLLNYEEAIAGLPLRPYDAAALGLMARWIGATGEGDMVGGDFPGWLPDLIGRGRSLGLSDRRGECIHSACRHYHRCFIEKSVRRARRARIVVANHALVMVQSALQDSEGATLPTRLVFDEGHHVFDAADAAFSLALTGQETAELRRWIVGAEESRRSRARGLKRRLDDLIAGDDEAMAALDHALSAARALPGEGWLQRVKDGRPLGACETFLALARRQVLARADQRDPNYSLEAELRPVIAGLAEAAENLRAALARLAAPLRAIAQRLAKRLEDEAAALDTPLRMRIEAMIRGLMRRGGIELAGWQAALAEIGAEPSPDFVDWLGIDRIDGNEFDVGLYRHWLDPTKPFAEFVAKPAHGVLVTSATLTDGGSDTVKDWEAAEARTGATHLARPAYRARVPSPFDYARQTRIFIVTDLARDDMAAVAGAYRALFEAAGGGALGLFTAIQRLREVHRRIAAPLEAAGVTLLAQHVDGMDTATLVDIFRAEEDACLLGTDAVRDGVDVPGRSLRLIVFDRVPWPRPDILQKARRAAKDGENGAVRYDDRLTRLKLRQAFGRLIRRADDMGVFVLLDRQMPSRLLGAFPEGVAVERLGLKDVAARTREFLAHKSVH
jgi:ATP-dependent DNA helicase DinG